MLFRSVCLNAIESALFERFLVPLAAQRPHLVILAARYGSMGVISHEILHGQYFLFAKFRAVADCYFDHVLDEAARKSGRADLASEYDVANPYLLRNEFQAYLLQGDRAAHLEPLRRTDRARLLAILAEAGGFPVLPAAVTAAAH